MDTLTCQAILVGYVMDRKELNLGLIISPENLTKEKQEQTSLLFLSLIITLCKQTRMLRNKKNDVEVTLLASTDIQRIEAEFIRDKEYKVRKKLTDKMPVIDIETLESGAVELGLETGITSSSLTLHSSLSSIPTGDA